MVYKELLTLKRLIYPGIDNILRVNKQIYREAKGLLYSLNTFQINIDNLDRLWLRESGQEINIEISRNQQHAPLNQWLKLPTYLEKCKKIKIILYARVDYAGWEAQQQQHFWWTQQQQHFWWNQQQQHFTPEDLTTMLMHFNSLVYTKLMKHKHLHTIHVELELTGEHNPQIQFSITEGQMREFEQGCLNTLAHLRGMRAVHLEGFTCVDPFDILLAKQGMLLPSSSWWTSFSTMPKVIQLAPQWWQLTNLSKYSLILHWTVSILIRAQGVYCNPSGRHVATTHNLGGVTFVAFHRPAWSSLTRGRSLTLQTHEVRSYHASMAQWHFAMLASLRQPPPPVIAPATSFVHCRTLVLHQALVRYWDSS